MGSVVGGAFGGEGSENKMTQGQFAGQGLCLDEADQSEYSYRLESTVLKEQERGMESEKGQGVAVN